MNENNIIFIIGSGRSGTTLLLNYLSVHPYVCWLSNLTNRHPQIGILPSFHRLLDLPWVDSQLKNNIVMNKKTWWFPLQPNEGDRIYHDYCGFSHNQLTTENDFEVEKEKCFKKVIHNHIKYTGKPFFIGKQTSNNQRIRLLHKMFPDAKYIHVIRDGRAVVNSLINVSWWSDTELWWADKKVQDMINEGEDSLIIAAEHWKKDTLNILEHREDFGENYFEIKYEDLINNTHVILESIIDHCGLKKESRYFNLVPQYSKLRNDWKVQLNSTQIEKLNEELKTVLEHLGYEV